MPSPHKFAALMLVKASPAQIAPNREELNALLGEQLATLEKLASGAPSACDR